MSKADEFKNYLPTYYYESRQMNAKCDTTGIEFDNLEVTIQELIEQCFPQTATRGIKLWENFLGIPINTNESLELRRAKVIDKLSRVSPMTPYEMKKSLEKFADTIEINQTPEEYTFEVVLGSESKIDYILSTIINIVEEIKPAHLAYSLTLKYITNILIIRSFKKWFSDVIPLCGTIDCSYNAYVSTEGRSNRTIMYEDITKGISDEFIKVSEQTMIPGNGKRLVENLELVITDFIADEVLKVSEELYLTGSTGKSLENIINDNLKSFLSDELLRTTGTDFKGLESIINTQFNKLYSDILEKAAENNYVEEEE